jgi:hypothetical protein
LIEQYNKHITQPQLDVEDGRRFLKFLDDNEAWAWTLELAAWLEAQKTSGGYGA